MRINYVSALEKQDEASPDHRVNWNKMLEGVTSAFSSQGSVERQQLPQEDAGLETSKWFKAVNAAEMTGIPAEEQWIRTRAVGSSSSAYGPAQLTKSLAEGYLVTNPDLFDDEEKAYMKRFIDQGEKFLKYGGGDWKKYDKGDGGWTQDELKTLFEYGGPGILNTPEDKALYVRVVDKMLGEIAGRNKNDPNKVWREWRFGAGSKKNDERYERMFRSALPTNPTA